MASPFGLLSSVLLPAIVLIGATSPRALGAYSVISLLKIPLTQRLPDGSTKIPSVGPRCDFDPPTTRFGLTLPLALGPKTSTLVPLLSEVYMLPEPSSARVPGMLNLVFGPAILTTGATLPDAVVPNASRLAPPRFAVKIRTFASGWRAFPSRASLRGALGT